MIEAVIFDFGRVISAPRPAARFRDYEAELGLPSGTINSIMFDSPAWQDALVGRMTMEAFWVAIGPALNLTTRRRIDAFRRRYYGDESVDPAVLALIRRLHGRYRLAVLSNHPPGLEEWLRAWKIRRFFDAVVVSGDEGLVKPDPAIYRMTLERLAVQPRQAVFIDDTPGHVTAARAMGLKGIVFRDARQLQDDLDALLADLKAAPPRG